MSSISRLSHDQLPFSGSNKTHLSAAVKTQQGVFPLLNPDYPEEVGPLKKLTPWQLFVEFYIECLPLALLERLMLFPGATFPHKTKLAKTNQFLNRQPDYTRNLANHIEKVSFTSAEGVRHNAWFVPPTEGRSTILYSGGNADSLRTLSHFRTLLAEHNNRHGFLIYEYPGYGRTKGKPTEESVYASLEAASDFLQDKKKIPVTEQVAYGLCMGAAVTVDVASRRPFKGVVLESIMPSVPDFLAEDISPTYMPTVLARVHSRFDSLSKIPKVKCPMLILHASHDPLSPGIFAQTIYFHAGTIPGLKELVFIPGDKHIIANELTLVKLQRFLDYLDSPEYEARAAFKTKLEPIAEEASALGSVYFLA